MPPYVCFCVCRTARLGPSPETSCANDTTNIHKKFHQILTTNKTVSSNIEVLIYNLEIWNREIPNADSVNRDWTLTWIGVLEPTESQPIESDRSSTVSSSIFAAVLSGQIKISNIPVSSFKGCNDLANYDPFEAVCHNEDIQLPPEYCDIQASPRIKQSR